MTVEYYHCAAISRQQRDDEAGKPVPFLCGKTSHDPVPSGLSYFDFAPRFNRLKRRESLPVCPTCASHQDLPILVLGQMDDIQIYEDE